MAKHKSGTEWFRPMIEGDGSKMEPYFKKGARYAFGHKFPLTLKDKKLKEDLTDLVKDEEHHVYFYASEDEK
jgi:hypothetical protein